MGQSGSKLGTGSIDDSTPEDVAALYRWANLTGAKYRDYSAERREQRARMRYRAAKQQLEEELEAQAQTGARGVEGGVHEAGKAETAARVALRASEEQREIAEAHESAQRKRQAFAEAERVRRERIGKLPGESARPGEQNAVDALPERASDLIAQIPTPEIVGSAAEKTLAAIRPAWLGPAAELVWQEEATAIASVSEPGAMFAPATRRSSVTTLLDSREQVALRWPALQALAQELRLNRAKVRISRRRGPVVAVVSPAGGAGGTSLAAMLARAFARDGERVLLVETVQQGLLPLYFGLGRLAAGELRAVASSEGESGAVSILALDMSTLVARDATGSQAKRVQESVIETLLACAQGCDRIVIDLAAGAAWIVRQTARLRPMVLAPVAPEMSSLAGLRAMEQEFAAIVDSEGRALLPFYVLNRFDAGLPLHLDIREVLQRELDERLLAVAVRRSATVGEALAEGRTVLDYAPDSQVARDYLDVARWLEQEAPASADAIASAAEGGR
jgi:cellulose synthase operon protein YhjQ